MGVVTNDDAPHVGTSPCRTSLILFQLDRERSPGPLPIRAIPWKKSLLNSPSSFGHSFHSMTAFIRPSPPAFFPPSFYRFSRRRGYRGADRIFGFDPRSLPVIKPRDLL